VEGVWIFSGTTHCTVVHYTLPEMVYWFDPPPPPTPSENGVNDYDYLVDRQGGWGVGVG